MSEFYVKVKGIKEVETALDDMAARMDKAMAQVAIKAAQTIEKNAKKDIVEVKDRKTGKIDQVPAKDLESHLKSLIK